MASSSRMVARTPLRRRLPMEKKICTELPEATSYRLHWSTRSTTRSVRCRMSFGDCFGSITSVSPPASSLGQLGRDGADSPPLTAQCSTQKCRSEPYRPTPTRSLKTISSLFQFAPFASSLKNCREFMGSNLGHGFRGGAGRFVGHAGSRRLARGLSEPARRRGDPGPEVDKREVRRSYRRRHAHLGGRRTRSFMPRGKSLLSTPPVERERSALGGEPVALLAPPLRFRQAPGIGAPLISLAR